jgi:mannose-6-phosphate isomerase-like protein (cupin superfamily)
LSFVCYDLDMNITKSRDYFEQNHPDKTVIELPLNSPTEIVCEVEPTTEHSEYSIAEAAIKQSEPHHHEKSLEEYKIISGALRLIIDGKEITLKEGDIYFVKPLQVHYAIGNFTLAQVTSRPDWTPEDHILDKI